MNAKLRTAKLGIALLLVTSTFTGVAVADTGETTGLNQGMVTSYKYKAENFTMFMTAKNLCDENIVQQRKKLIDQFIMQFGDKIPPRYIGAAEDLKPSDDTKLVSYGFKIFPDGVTKEYRGYCSKDLEGYEKAISKANKWFSSIDTESAIINKETSDMNELRSIDEWNPMDELRIYEWDLINNYTEDYTFSPYGDYSTRTEWFWDDIETKSEKDYFMLRSRFSIAPGHDEYNNNWLNYRGYINHDWKYYDYPGSRDMYDAVPYDSNGETSVSVTSSGSAVALIWLSFIPGYNLNDKSDYIDDVAEWELTINPLSTTCGGDTFSVQTGSGAHCSQDEARSGSWLGLAYFEAKPMWVQMDPFNSYTPGFHGNSNCVRWTGSEYDE